ncbi:aminotransferase class V-fold PLP-dependent enzyme [Vibrio harveyi]|nr:aminotransferase class V-fold PLP-dependent enzyme [Vibrio harveyi]
MKPLFLTSEYAIDINKLDQVINSKTKIITFAHISNTTGYVNDIKAIIKKIRSLKDDVIVVVDAAQSAAHAKVDVID